ncbi:ABC transporter substrate-binding protein [Acetobacterium carbinolicum]|jgi:iron complex transport system substrate-binding protein|uniref:ABC transporter substrate-binding protein n=1 Tax=Acetobacterium TaxID=33951 RepID=UPI000DBEC32B|nr:ABC transporter substrate-binding protein [Acetobacterium sp. KB-1]AWW25858.1 ABC transporter substrate-binding protein [Acetobacterium sp. KB-1]
MKRFKAIVALFCVLLTGLMGLTGCSTTEAVQTTGDSEIRFIDDSGVEISLSEPAKKVVSLYSAHTENLFSMGLDSEIIGVGTSDNYPEAVLEKEQFSYKDDPELLIAADPDVVIARTMIVERYPDYVKAIEDAGIPVINLYCSKFDDFDNYITRLAMIVGKDAEGEALLENFHSQIDEIQKKGEGIDPRKTAYFESIGDKFKTVTQDSFAGKALTIIGLNNIAQDIESDGSATVVEFGEENLLSKSNEIDVYIAQEGTMNKLISVETIEARPGFSQIKAVIEGELYIIDEKLISSATLRYLDGLKELQNKIYGV